MSADINAGIILAAIKDGRICPVGRTGTAACDRRHKLAELEEVPARIAELSDIEVLGPTHRFLMHERQLDQP